MIYAVWVSYKNTEDDEWHDEYLGKFKDEEEAEEAYDKLIDEWLSSHDPYEWVHDQLELEENDGKIDLNKANEEDDEDDESEEVTYVVRMTVKAGTNADHVMSILNDRAYDIDGVEDFDFVEQ